MKRIVTFLLLIHFALVQYGQIIADHTVVDRYDDIPQYYIDKVKEMWLVYAGESHSAAVRTGLTLLEAADPAFQVSVIESGTPEAYTTFNLRASRATWGNYDNASGWIYSYGEEDWYTNPTAVARTKSGITYCNTNSLTIAAIGFGWCSDMTSGNISATTDPVYGFYWFGSSRGGPDGDKAWGIETEDYAITGNSVNMGTYLSVTQGYNDYCAANGYSTKVFFTTGPVDAGANWIMMNGYQGHIKHEYIRDYIEADPTRILFDYADILCYNNDGTLATTTWNGHEYPVIHPDNMLGTETGHIGSVGALRLAKAMWWMLARIAGWDGSTASIPVTSITVTGSGGLTQITQDNGTLQLSATVLPTNATNKAVTWSIANGTGQATINSTGLVTAVSNGTVTVRATANDGSGVYGQLVITISNQIIPVTSITVTGAGGMTQITQDNGTLQLTTAVLPTNATNKSVTWSISNGTGQATISSTGLVTAVSNGTVTARATANDSSGVYGQLVITISNQVIPVTSITVTGAGGLSQITQDNGTLQLTASVLPANATNKAVTWSIANGTGQATINSTGLVTAVSNGTVTARATANDGSGVTGTLVITITNQFIPVSSITVNGTGGSSTITIDNGTLQLTAAVLPTNATNKAVTWSIANGTGQATISSTGLVTAVSNGTVTARATANDGSGVYGQLVITISNQVIPVTSITVTGAGGSTLISQDNGTLQLTATVTPINATNKTVTWSMVNGTGQATINSTGLVTAVSNGTVTARATANDGSGIVGSLVITISSQVIPVTRIDVASTKGVATITTDNGTLQLNVTIIPSNATNQTVTWSIINGTGQASISSSGLVTAIANGTVTARATANDGSGVYGDMSITIANQFVAVAGITIFGEGGVTIIDIDDGTLQMMAMVAPENATNKTVTWSLVTGDGHATISETGLVTARSNGTVTVRAVANDGSNVFGDLQITLSNQMVPVSSIRVKPKNKTTNATAVDGTLQLETEILPADATAQNVEWSVISKSGEATIDQTGLLTGVSPGEVVAMATATDGSGVIGELTITIDLVESIKITFSRTELRVLVPNRLLPAKASLHNLYGAHLQTKVVDTTECIFDIAGLMPGIYVVSVYNSKVQDAAKIVIAY